MDNKKIFISYSHKDKELKDQVVSHLNAIKLPIDIWVDKSEIDAGDEWEIKIKNAIEQSEMAILLISTDFLNSKFITEKELPWVITRKSLYNYRVIPFILKPSVWDEHEFYKTLEVKPKEKALIKYSEENGDRDEILVDFAKEVKGLVGKVEEPKTVDESKLFYKTFAILRVLELYNKDEEYSFKLTSNLSIYKKGQEYPIEIWKFVEEIESIEEYANMVYDIFDKDHMDTFIGIVQKDRLSPVFRELASFFDTLKLVKKYDEEVKLKICKDFNSQHDIGTFTGTFFKNNTSLMNKIFDLNSPMAIFYFTNFNISGFLSTELRTKIFDLISKKFKIKLEEDGVSIFHIKPFLNVFTKALEFMDINYGNYIEFHNLLSQVDVLKLPFENKNSLDFIEKNLDLVEKNISDHIDINIEKLYVKSKAKFYYKGKYDKYENVENLSNWLEDQMDLKDFTILLGDFGHGKTTFFKYMTAELSKKYLAQKDESKNYIPVYLSLRQHFTKDANLKDAVTNAVMPRAKMTDEFWQNNNWLIFCDGFDELSIYHQDEPNWITKVFSILYTQSEEKNIKIVLSSRPVLFLDPNIKKETLSQFNRLVLKPFDEPQITKWLENWSKYNKPISIEDIKERNLMEVSQTPVILFLIASMFHEELNEENLKYSKSQIYKKFFDWTAKSGGLIQNGENVKHKVPDNYREILQEVACEIFSHPDAKSGMLHYEVLLKQLSQKFDGIDLKKSLNEKIFVAHAFKESVPEHIEFIHQSLREYLVVEKIFNLYYKFLDVNKPFTAKELDLTLSILTQPITIAKLNFFKDMIFSIDKNKKEEFKSNLLPKIDIEYIVEGLVHKKRKYLNIFKLSNKNIHDIPIYKVSYNVIGNILLLHFTFRIYISNYVDISELNEIISLFKSNEKLIVFFKLLQKMFINFKFEHTKLYDINFDNFEFNYTTFAESIFNGNSFKNTQIMNSKFIPYKKAETIFMNCNFEKTIIDNTIFSKLTFRDCSFKDIQGFKIADFINVKFENCTFDSCIIYSPNYKKSKFIDCIFIDVNFISEVDNSLINLNDYKKTNKIDIEFVNCISRDKYNDEHEKWNIIDNDDSIWRDSRDFR